MQEIQDAYRDLVEKSGYTVGVGSVDCTVFKTDHRSCTGCQHEMGCNKLARLMLVGLIPLGYTPASFADHQAMMGRMNELSRGIMDAETVEQLKGLPYP